MTDFVHLHVHTHYSLLDGMAKIPDLLDRAKELGMSSLAITDHGVMYGAVEFYKEAKKRGIKPIIGLEGYISPRGMTDKSTKEDRGPGHIILLAKNREGYLNLLKLSTAAHLEGYYYKPRFDKDFLKKHSNGLIAMTACVKGEVGRHILAGSFEKAKKSALEFEKIFGKGNFFLELQYIHNNWEPQIKVNEGLKKLSKETGIPLVATNDSHYIFPEDQEAQDCLLCLQTGSFVNDEKRMKMDGNQSLITPDEMAKFFKDVPEAISNTVKIAEQCDLELELGGILIPDFEVPKGETVDTYVRKKVYEGIEKKYGHITDEIKERAEYELDVIKKMGFSGYFLIVWDFVKWAKDNGIVVGPGRGSAAGSIVAYALDITELDPLKYDLLFERFLNPDRISMPDIDMDFADDRRNEVIQYVSEKYGRDHVAQIITFGTMKARNAIRDTGRVLGFPYSEVDRIAKMVPEVIGIKLKEALETSQELKSEYNNSPEIKHLLDLAMKLEGVARHSSTHAAGVVISKLPLTEYTPLQTATKGDLAINTQYSMGPIEDLGLLKFDFLGLSNLTVIKNALRIIKKVYDDDIDISNLPLDDEKTFELFGRADTTGVFQLESGGMKKNIKELKPTTLEDIIAMVALYRPGPMQFIPDFIKRKHGKQKIVYDHPLMEPALKNTYGVIVYQEQVMRVAKEMAGFTGGESDTLRKAMGKKIADLMKKMRVQFVAGSIKNGVPEKTAKKIFDDFEEFSKYAFNKSHAACYALIAYQTAYLKAHYPAAFMAALMTSDYGNIDRIAIEIDECRKMGIEVLPPDVNESFAEFSVVKETGKIRFGLKAVKNVGLGIIQAIEKARGEGGSFKNMTDFAKRVEGKEINKKVMEALIKCGAFDSMGERADMLHNLERILNYVNKISKEQASGQTDLFGGKVEFPDIHLEKSPIKLTKKEKLDWEKELLGVYITDHPLKEYLHVLEAEGVSKCSDLLELDDKSEVSVGGVITVVQKIYTRNKEPMLFCRMEDAVSSVELVVFPKILQKYPTKFAEGKIIIATGKYNNKDGAAKILVESVKELNPETAKAMKGLIFEDDELYEIYVPESTSGDILSELKKLLLENRGEKDTYVFLKTNGNTSKIKLPFGVSSSKVLDDKIKSLLSS